MKIYKTTEISQDIINKYFPEKVYDEAGSSGIICFYGIQEDSDKMDSDSGLKKSDSADSDIMDSDYVDSGIEDSDSDTTDPDTTDSDTTDFDTTDPDTTDSDSTQITDSAENIINAIGCAFFIKGSIPRLLWIAVEPEYLGTGVASGIMEASERYFYSQNKQIIVACLEGDAYTIGRGVNFIENGGYEMLPGFSRSLTYSVEELEKKGFLQKFYEKAKKYENHIKSFNEYGLKQDRSFFNKVRDLRYSSMEVIDADHSFVCVMNNEMIGMAVICRSSNEEMFVSDIWVDHSKDKKLVFMVILLGIVKTYKGFKRVRLVLRDKAIYEAFKRDIGRPIKDDFYIEYVKSIEGDE